MQRFLRIIIISIVLLFAVVLFIGNYFYGESVKRGTEVELHSEVEPVNKVGDEDDDGESKFEIATEWFSKQEPEQKTIQSYDDLTLSAQLIENEVDSNKAVVLVHGFRKEGLDMGDYTKFYYENDFHILMPDARGHGNSEGNYYGYGWHDRLDIINWTQFLIDNYNVEEVVLHGNSAGAATVLITSGEQSLHEEVKAIIADSSYTTMKDELAHQLKHLYSLPPTPLLEITSLITKVRAGYFFGDVNVLKQVEKNSRPLFLVHGESDDLVPTHMSEDIFEVAAGEKELWLVPDAGHIKAYEVETEQFEERLSLFLQKHITE